MVKLSINLEREDHSWAAERSQVLYGRRGIAQYLRKLIREDRSRVTGDVDQIWDPLGKKEEQV